MEDHAANQLNVEVPHVERAAAGLADDGEGFRQEIVERFPFAETLAEFGGPGADLFVGKRLDGRFEGVDVRDDRPQPLELTLVGRTEDFREGFIDDHRGWLIRQL